MIVSVASGSTRRPCWTRRSAAGVPAARIGRTGGRAIRIAVDGQVAIDCAVAEAEARWSGESRELARRPRGVAADEHHGQVQEECGVFGIYGHTEAANLTYLGLYALQHRGQESVGIATSDGERLQIHKAMGYVADNFDEATFARLAGTSAVGHVRYSTAGESGLKNAQPILIDCAHGEIAICHNGNLVNAQELRDALVARGIDLPDDQRHRSAAAPLRAIEGRRRPSRR